MKYRIVIERPARKFIQKQPREQQERIVAARYKLPYEGDIFPIRGQKGRYRVRIGTYRAIYDLYQDVLTSRWTIGAMCIKGYNRAKKRER